ncbi:STAS domain-containing protein [Krasilnikovia sp. MM14-A1004]|uniref:STAS domain-containing protein n=1 Tax=Krasilnikovia sp. MM14-A1004 TaxID=3373541 RepID=UPI00399D4BC3
MAPVGCMVEQVGTRVLVRLRGELSPANALRVRAELLKCAVERPDALVVDVTDLTVRDPGAASVFRAVAWQAATWPGTPLLLCTPDAQTARRLTHGCRRLLPVFASADQALTARPRRRVTVLHDTLLPVTGAARRARDLATEACARWQLPALVGPACLIADELATNALTHARTMADIRFAVGRHHLMISVRDGSAARPAPVREPLPHAASGLGLLLVDATAHRWGCLPVDGGKVVWAYLRTGATD